MKWSMQGRNQFVRKLESPQEPRRKKSKPGWQIRQETHLKKIHENRPKKGKMQEYIRTKKKRQRKKK